MADIIDTLLGLDDAQLTAKLGFAKQVDKIKSDLQAASELQGAQRKVVVDRIEQMMSPDFYPNAIEHAVDEAKRTEESKTKGEAMADPAENDPASMMEH